MEYTTVLSEGIWNVHIEWNADCTTLEAKLRNHFNMYCISKLKMFGECGAIPNKVKGKVFPMLN